MDMNEKIKINPKLLKRIYELSKETNKNSSYHLNKALEDYIEERDDLKEAFKRLKNKSDRIISQKQIRKSIG
jgi:predicted DNA-binding protein